jgi:hypothetical protein
LVSAPGYPNDSSQAGMTINAVKSESQRRILVTGSRGKSSIVRLLHAAMNAAGLKTYARITGVVPRELGADGIRTISRSAGAHVEEMRWWLGQLPASAQGVVLENSAIAAEFQGLASRWLQPDVTVLTNTLPDHQEQWGPTSASAAGVLVAGIPKQGHVVLPARLQSDGYLLGLLERRRCRLKFAGSVPAGGEDYRAANLGLALAALEYLGLAGESALGAMQCLRPDRYDFRVAVCDGAEVAMAFSVNDITSTQALFRSLKWSADETRLLYNHRADRPGRYRSFIDWLGLSHWREVLIIGDKPRKQPRLAHYLSIENEQGLRRLFKPGDRIFGCGNIAGLPLSLSAVLDR